MSVSDSFQKVQTLLGLSYSFFRRTQEKAASVQTEYERIRALMARHAAARDNTVLLAVKYSWLDALGRLFPLSKGRQRERLRALMCDYQQDLLCQLEEAVSRESGFEEDLFFDVVFNAAESTNRELKRLRDEVKGHERKAVEHILEQSSECVRILWAHGEEFTGRFNAERGEIRGNDDEK